MYEFDIGREISTFRDFITNSAELVKYINKANGLDDCFISLYTLEECRNYQSSKITKIFLDFDGETAQKDILRLNGFLHTHQIRHTHFFSGSYYHAYIFTKPMRVANPKPYIKSFQLLLKDKLGLDSLDTHCLGNVSQMVRLPFTLNIGAKKFCVPLHSEELDLTPEKISKLDLQHRSIIVEGHRLVNLHRISPIEPNPSPIVSTSHYFPDLDFVGVLPSIDDFPLCIQRVLRKKSPSHNERFMLVTYLANQLSFGFYIEEDYIKDEIIDAIFHFIKAQRWKDWNSYLTHYHISQIINHPYSFPKCNWIQEKLSLDPRICMRCKI